MKRDRILTQAFFIGYHHITRMCKFTFAYAPVRIKIFIPEKDCFFFIYEKGGSEFIYEFAYSLKFWPVFILFGQNNMEFLIKEIVHLTDSRFSRIES